MEYKKNLIIILVIIAVAVAGIFVFSSKSKQGEETISPAQPAKNAEEEAINQVESLVEEFGKKLQNVYLTSPESQLRKDVEENYRDFLSPTLLALWLENPSQRLGRFTSSPWPDRIEIESIEKIDNSKYQVKGEIIEITSIEMVEGGVAASRDIELTVEKINGKWLISEIIVGEYR